MAFRYDKSNGALIVQHEGLEEVLQEFTVQELIDAINAVYDAADRATIAAGI